MNLIKVVKNRLKEQKKFLSNPELIHFGGDQYTLDKIKGVERSKRSRTF